MRFKFVAIIALLVMMSGVIGIITQGENGKKEEEAANAPIKVKSIYFISNKDFNVGDLVNKSDVTERRVEYYENDKPDWIEGVIDKDTLESLLVDGAIANRKIKSDEMLKKDSLSMMSAQLTEEYVIMPVSMLSTSLNNPDIPNKGFIDIYLLSNDNGVYRKNYLSSSDRGDKNYKDTRVKLFAKQVFYIKNFSQANKFYQQLSDGLVSSKKADDENEVSSTQAHMANENMSVIYAYFKRVDIEKVIQGQMLGVFVASPGKVKNLRDGFSIIVGSSREVTPSDIVSGAPSPGNSNQILEIRGAN